MSKKRATFLHPLVLCIKAEARDRGWTAYRLAQETRLSVTTMQRLFTGVGSPTLDTLDAVAKALDITIKGTRDR